MTLYEDSLSDEQKAARDSLADLLQRNAKIMGPWGDSDDEAPIPEAMFMTDFVVVVAWTDGEGGNWLTRIPSKNLPSYRRVGLMHEGLYGFDD